MKMNKDPNITKASLAPSASVRGKAIDCDLARLLTVTIRNTYNAAGTDSAKVSFLFTPDGTHFDTIAYTSFENTITAGAKVQQTVIVDPPETGYIVPVVTNQDAVHPITRLKVWTNISKYWEDIHGAMDPHHSRLER